MAIEGSIQKTLNLTLFEQKNIVADCEAKFGRKKHWDFIAKVPKMVCFFVWGLWDVWKGMDNEKRYTDTPLVAEVL